MDSNRRGTGWQARIGRRRLLRTSAAMGAGLAGAALVGCGGADGDGTTGTPAPTSSPTGGGAQADTAATIIGDNWGVRDPDATPRYGGTLNWAYQAPTLANLDPLLSTSGMVHQVAGQAYDHLTRVSRPPADRNGLHIHYPALAESWETADPLRLTYRLRPGIRWHNVAPVDGRDFTAEDVKYAIERATEQETSLFRGNFASIESIEVPDATTVVINTSQFDPLLFGNLSNQGPWVVPRELVEADQVSDRMVGTGPFIFDQWERDSRIAFKKNPDYFISGTPFLDELNLLQIGNEETRTASFRAEQTQIGDIPFQDLAQFEDDPQFVIEPYLRVAPQVLFMNAQEDRWRDERVRRAISLALDTDILVELLVGEGLWRGIVSNQHGGWTLSQEELKGDRYYLRHDPQEARQLMEAAGHAGGLEAGLLYNTQYPQYYQDATQYIIEALSTAGVAQLTGVGQDHATMRRNQDEHNYDGMCFGLDGQGFPEQYLMDFRTGGSKNGSGLSDPEVDADVNEVLSIVDVAERQEATKAFIDDYLQRVMYKVEFADGMFYEAWTQRTRNYIPPPPFQFSSAKGFVWLDEA
ncbi:MAG: ABC transporter substrate-binding protein [Dehalococcoidia bacterium]